MVNTPGFRVLDPMQYMDGKVSYDTEAEPVETDRGSVLWHRHTLFILCRCRIFWCWAVFFQSWKCMEMLLMLDFRSQSRILDPIIFYDFLVRPRLHTPWCPHLSSMRTQNSSTESPGPGPAGPRHGLSCRRDTSSTDLSPADWLMLPFLWPCLSRSSEKNPPLSFSNMFSIHLLACLLLHFFFCLCRCSQLREMPTQCRDVIQNGGRTRHSPWHLGGPQHRPLTRDHQRIAKLIVK